MPIDYFTGFNHRILSAAGRAVFDGIIDSATGATIDTTVSLFGGQTLKRTGTNGGAQFYKQLSADSNQVAMAAWWLPASVAPVAGTEAGVIWFRDAAGTSGVDIRAVRNPVSSSQSLVCRTLSAGVEVTRDTHTVVPQNNSWYYVEARIDTSTNPWSIFWRVKEFGGAFSERSFTSPIAATQMRFGYISDSGTVDGLVEHFNLWALARAQTTYIGEKQSLGYVPRASGAHNVGAAAFPSAGVLDNFDRADENPLSGGGAWTTLGGRTALKLTSNFVVANAAFSTSYRGSYTNPEVYVQCGTLEFAKDHELLARLTDTVSPIQNATKTGYALAFKRTTYRLLKYVGGAAHTVSAETSWASGDLATNDWVGFRVNGTTLEVWVRRGTGAWVREYQTTDATVTGAGAIGLSSESLTSAFDNFGGGEYAAVGAFFQHDGTTKTALVAGETTSWQRLDEIPLGSGVDRVQIDAGTAPLASQYAEHAYQTGDVVAPDAVRVIDAVRNDVGQTANAITGKIAEGAAEAAIYSNLSLGFEATQYRGATFTTKPSGGAWTADAVAALTHRWGYTADPDSTPRLEGTMIETLFTPAVGGGGGGAAASLPLLGVG